VPDSSIKNIIFDLGGVILNLSINNTLTSFANLSQIPPKEIERIFISAPEFEHFEKGLIDDAGFRQFIRKAYKIQASDAEIDSCWNAMLLDIPVEKLELLKKLKKQYTTFLLSNTNGIHLEYINNVILPKTTGENNLDEYFHKSYYSHRMGKRKPEPDIFEQVLTDNKLESSETLFLDDNALNTEGAVKVGIKTQYITSPEQVFNVFR
jgi:glucose-1-phosphatase